MALIELKMEISAAAAERADECLLERQEQRWLVVEDAVARRAWIAGVFSGRGTAEKAWLGLKGALELAGVGFIGAPEWRDLADVDWKNSYKEHFKAWKYGRLNWVPVWEKESFQLAAGEQVLWLDPGMAFGTGNHETTQLCCERLVTHARENGTGARVVDVGCGSGILALSAARLGFREIVAFDNDSLAIEVSRANAQLNNLTERVDFFVGDLVTGLAGRRAELVMANIQADVLRRFAAELAGALAPSGRLVLSGILAAELESVRQTFARALPRAWTESRTLGEWSDLVVAVGAAGREAAEESARLPAS